MSATDPHSRRLRGQLGNAIRWGDTDHVAELRRRLAVENIARVIRKELSVSGPLTPAQVGELVAALYADVPPDPELRAAVDAAGAAVDGYAALVSTP